MSIQISDTIHIEETAPQHAHALYHAVHTNRAHLSAFLPWVDYMNSLESMENYISHCQNLRQSGKEKSFVIFSNRILVGRIGLHYIQAENKSATIGYWLIKNMEGNGIITQCCAKIIDLGFQEILLNRIEIKAAMKNIRSQAIPEKLGFFREGILRQAELVNGQFLDLYLYSLLANEWKKNETEI